MKETVIQAQIRQSIKKDGGYCHKLTNAFTVGIPDLLIALPPFVPCVIEVKDQKTVTPGFDQQIDVSPKQAHELKRITEVYLKYTSFHPIVVVSGLLVHCYMNRVHYLTGLPHDARRMTYDLMLDPTRTRKRGLEEYWDVRPLLEAIGIARI